MYLLNPSIQAGYEKMTNFKLLILCHILLTRNSLVGIEVIQVKRIKMI